MKKIFLCTGLFVLILFCANTIRAQERLKLNLGYNTGMPVGDFSNFMGKNSFRGFNGSLMYDISQQFNIGLGVSSQDYYEKLPRQLYDTKDGVISAVVTNSLQTMPIMIRGNYNFLKDTKITPYVGMGAGFNLIKYSQYLGEFDGGNTHFKPAASIDAGLNLFFNETKAAGINLGANFNYMPYNENALKNLNNWGIHTGIFFSLR